MLKVLEAIDTLPGLCEVSIPGKTLDTVSQFSCQVDELLTSTRSFRQPSTSHHTTMAAAEMLVQEPEEDEDKLPQWASVDHHGAIDSVGECTLLS